MNCWAPQDSFAVYSLFYDIATSNFDNPFRGIRAGIDFFEKMRKTVAATAEDVSSGEHDPSLS